MSSKYVKDLEKTSNWLKTLGFDWSASVCAESAVRMEHLERHIVELWKEKNE